LGSRLSPANGRLVVQYQGAPSCKTGWCASSQVLQLPLAELRASSWRAGKQQGFLDAPFLQASDLQSRAPTADSFREAWFKDAITGKNDAARDVVLQLSNVTGPVVANQGETQILSSNSSALGSTLYPLDPLSDIGRTILEFDAIGLAAGEKFHRALVDECHVPQIQYQLLPRCLQGERCRSSLTSSSSIRPLSVRTTLPLADL
jgi:hypothetical protein